MNASIHLSDEAQPAVREAIAGPLVAYNTQKTGTNDYRPLVLAVHNESGHVIGGLWGRTAFGWLFVELLFVPDLLRGRGIGAELMSRAESEAIVRGCHSAWLDTFEFQDRGFYERLGYICFGQLNDYPPGFARYFLKKALSK
jgi:GNAT superfamily N-acetyltransferase